MIDFSREELLKLTRLSGLNLNEQEINLLQEQLKKTLTYIQEIEQFDITHEHEAIKNVNVFRDDIALPTNSETIIAQAPQTSETFFVVPKILDQE